MTQEDKQLLLVDLCARLPYGVIVNICNINGMICNVILSEDNITNAFRIPDGWWKYCKPYLRPMSSMTKEEKEELHQEQIKDEQLFANCIKNHPEMRGLIIPHFAADWCDKNMFDYRDLITKGLALEAPKGMYKIEEQQ